MREAAIQFVGLLLGVGVQHHDGVDGGTVLVVRVDALQVLAHQLAAGETAGLHGVVHLRDGGFLHFEGRGFLRRQPGRSKKDAAEEANHQIIV